MARIRSIKPSFWTDEKLTQVPILVRYTFLGLISHADDEGRLRGDPRLIKAAVYPLDDDITTVNVGECLTKLAEIGRIDRYEVGGVQYIQLVNWSKHQKIDRSTRSECPPSPRQQRGLDEGSTSEERALDDDSLQDKERSKDRERSKEKGKTSAAGAPKSSLDKSAPWLGLIAPIWEKHYGGKIHKGRAAKALRPVIAEIGETETALRFERYCATTEAPYASVEKFASAHGSYAVGGAPGVAAARALYDVLVKLDVCGVDTSLARDRMRAGVAEGVVGRDDATWIWKALGKGEIDGMLVRNAPDKIALAHLETVLARRPQNGDDHA